MRSNTILLIPLLFLKAAGSSSVSYDVYLQLSQFRTSVPVIPYRVYELRWEIECTTDERQPITKFPTAFAIDDSRLLFFDAFSHQTQPRASQEQQNFVYVRRVSEMAVVCFRLYYRNELALEDCLVVDVRASDFADVRYSTKTRAHGNALTYQAQITPSNGLYLLLIKYDSNETLSTNTTTHHRPSSACIAAAALASVEAIFILLTILTGLCWFFHKSGRLPLGKLRRKRRSLGTGRLEKKMHMLKPKMANPQNQQPTVVVKPVAATVSRLATPEQHYRAPSASSADSGLSTMSDGSSSIHSGRKGTKKSPVVIYDDPPEVCCETATSTEAKKRPSVHDYLSEMWKRNRPRASPPPPPVPDYRGVAESEPVESISQSLAHDIYAALEDPNNWDPPEQFCWSSSRDPTSQSADAHSGRGDCEMDENA